MLKFINRFNNIGLKDKEIRQGRINIEQLKISNIEIDNTPIKILNPSQNNLINNRLLFKSTDKFLINPVNKKKLTRQKPVESIYDDRPIQKNYKINLDKSNKNIYPYLYPYEYLYENNKTTSTKTTSKTVEEFNEKLNPNNLNYIYIITIIIIIYLIY